jgi:hypothetical protein
MRANSIVEMYVCVEVSKVGCFYSPSNQVVMSMIGKLFRILGCLSAIAVFMTGAILLSFEQSSQMAKSREASTFGGAPYDCVALPTRVCGDPGGGIPAGLACGAGNNCGGSVCSGGGNVPSEYCDIHSCMGWWGWGCCTIDVNVPCPGYLSGCDPFGICQNIGGGSCGVSVKCL